MLPAENLNNKIKEFWPNNGPSIDHIGKYVKKYVKKFYYRLKILDAVFENNKELDINEYFYKIDTLPKENIDQISSNLKELYNRILI